MIKTFKDFYLQIVNFGEAMQPYLLLALRLIWGYLFFITGYYKLTHLTEVAAHFANHGIPFPEINVALVGSLELIGGVLLFLGLASRLVAIPLIIVMVVALLSAHSEAVWNVFSNPGDLLQQSPTTYLLVCLIIFAFGPGPISLDYLLKRFVK